MPSPRKSGRERGGNKKPAGAAQGHRKSKTPVAPPAPDQGAEVIALPVAGEIVDVDDGEELEDLRAGIVDGVQTPPIALGEVAARAWNLFWLSPVATAVADSDLYALERWIKNVEQLEVCRETIEEQGLTTKGSTQQVRLHPLFKRINELEDLIQRAEKKFGMTPLDRMQLGLAVGENELTAEKINQLARERAANASSKPKKPRSLPAGGNEEEEFEAV